MRRLLTTAIALVCIASCADGPPRTEIIVAVDTDLQVPGELDGVRIDMVGPGGELRRTMGPLTGPDSLPATVGMVYRTGALGPVQVTIVGTAAGMDIIQRRATVSFIEGRTLVLWIQLARECLDLRCPSDQTCAPGGCRPIDVDPSELANWSGSIDRMDSGTPGDSSIDGGDACVPVAEACNAADDDCDGAIDEDFDTAMDVANCGMCGNACPESPPNAASGCAAGACTLACDPGFDDCDSDAATGCEALLSAAETCGGCLTTCVDPDPLCQGDPGSGFACVSTCSAGLTECDSVCADLQTDALNCGACGTSCMVGAHASATCTAGSCGMACDPDFDDCDGDPTNGCEESLLDVAHCGGCGVLCDLPSGIESCATGTCLLTGCDFGFDDCDMDDATGCETDVAASTSDCGTCGMTCPAAPVNSASVCTMGACEFSCDLGFGDCDADPMNGCESLLSDAMTCGTCGITCSGATPVCDGSAGSGFTCVASCSAPSTICGTACTDVATDPLNCGSCGMTCAGAPQASPACVSSACDITCDPGFGDCNASVADGCELDVTTETDCGACGAVCAPTNATGVCAGGMCGVASCDADWLDCDGDPTNGCETSRSSMGNCGACGVVCPMTAPNATSATCGSGTCNLTCTSGFGNCNGDPADGCETTLTTVMDCGACGSSCVLSNATATCTTGSCEIVSCDPGFDDCDTAPTNGCEANLSSSRRNCAMCGIECATPTNRCCSGVCSRPPC